MADKKKALIDSSSAIILYKADFIEAHIKFYNTIIPESVYTEISRNGYQGADFFRACRNNGTITVEQVFEDNNTCGMSLRELSRLGRGEHDTILLYLNGTAGFVVIDDKDGNAFCRDNGIQYINALLVPKIYYCSGIISEIECKTVVERIISIGRYSKSIIDYAMNSERKDLEDFLIEGILF